MDKCSDESSENPPVCLTYEVVIFEEEQITINLARVDARVAVESLVLTVNKIVWFKTCE